LTNQHPGIGHLFSAAKYFGCLYQPSSGKIHVLKRTDITSDGILKIASFGSLLLVVIQSNSVKTT